MHELPLSLLEDSDDVISIGMLLRLRDLNFHDTLLRTTFTQFLEDARREDIKGADARRKKICIGEFGFYFISPLDIDFKSGTSSRNISNVETTFNAFLNMIHRQYFNPTNELIKLRLDDLVEHEEKGKDAKIAYLESLEDCITQQASDLIRTRVEPLRYRRALEELFDEHAFLDIHQNSPASEQGAIETFFCEGTPNRDLSLARKAWTICLIRLTANETEAIFGRSPLEDVQLYSPLNCIVVFERAMIGKEYCAIPIVKISLRTNFPQS